MPISIMTSVAETSNKLMTSVVDTSDKTLNRNISATAHKNEKWF